MDNWLKNNNVLKGLSIVFAIMLWMVVNIDNSASSNENNNAVNTRNTYFYEANVTALYDSEQYVLDMSTERINVVLSGDKSLIDKINNGEYLDKGKFFINLNSNNLGTYEVPIEYEGFPEQLEVEIQPSKITVVLEQKQRKEMEVLIDKLGKEAEGFQAGEPIVKPKRVHVSGTSEQVNKVAFVKAFINIDRINNSISQQVILRAIDQNGNEVHVEIVPQTVEVQIPVTSPYKTVPVTYSISAYPPSGFAIKSLTQLTKEITIYGFKEVVDNYSVYSGPILDLSAITASQSLKVSIPLADDLQKIEPENIEFFVEIVQAERQTITNVPIEISGLTAGLKASVIDPVEGASVTLEGAAEVLAEISIEDLQAFVDLSNLPIGEYELPITYNIPLLTTNFAATELAKVIITEE